MSLRNRQPSKKRCFCDPDDSDAPSNVGHGGARPGAGRPSYDHNARILLKQKTRERWQDYARKSRAKKLKMSSLESTIEDLRPRTGQSATVAEARSALLMLAQVQKDNMEWTHSDSVLHVAHLMHRGSDYSWCFALRTNSYTSRLNW